MPSQAGGGVSVPLFEPDGIRHRRRIADWASQVMVGRLACTGEVTLVAGATTTVVTDTRVGVNTMPILQPATANALSAHPTVYVSGVTNGSFTITHPATAAVDKTFRYVLLT